MHSHHDLLITADSDTKEVLRATSVDVFVGSPPLAFAFTFGFGGLAILPLCFSADATLLEHVPPNVQIASHETKAPRQSHHLRLRHPRRCQHWRHIDL